LIENGLAPRVLGSFTGLNPFWVFIAILSGARVGGLLGVIVAVPAAVVLKEALMAIRSAQRSLETTNPDLTNLETLHESEEKLDQDLSESISAVTTKEP
ncbi:MAG: AI-2E family transporter, partial [Leptolyngbya sp. SIO1D8]|nr:AI-2E family transporter [Leptolyngbya sp. SIO1D8]